jgi:hypothetical protein
MTDRRPGPFPERIVWRGWRSVGGLALAAVLAAALLIHDHYLMGAVILGLGLWCAAEGLLTGDQRMRENLRYTRGNGWWVGWLMSKLPGAGSRVAFIVLSLGIIGLGVAELVSG